MCHVVIANQKISAYDILAASGTGQKHNNFEHQKYDSLEQITYRGSNHVIWSKGRCWEWRNRNWAEFFRGHNTIETAIKKYGIVF